jgi:ectoine hydroxylase-related dioxygenase (phytanoyl-CoA dioxygenase family)
MNIVPKAEEIASGAFGEQHLAKVVEAIQEDGYVVIEQVVDLAYLDVLKERMDEDSERLIAAERWGGAGRKRGHLQQGPPAFAPFLHADVVVNPYAVQIAREMLGSGFYCCFYNGNTNTPGSGFQPLHADGIHLWENEDAPHPVTQLIVNVWPQDASEANGATQIWPGSHLDMRPVTDEVEADRRAFSPPTQPAVKKGDILVRDSRLWHRGVPNPSDHNRHMVATVYNIGWMVKRRTLFFEKGSEAMFEAAGVDANAEFIDQPFEYLFEMACRKLDPDPMRGV